jgi:hypothetical protein
MTLTEPGDGLDFWRGVLSAALIYAATAAVVFLFL